MEFTEYFRKLPIKYRKNKCLYNYYVNNLDLKIAEYKANPKRLFLKRIVHKGLSLFMQRNELHTYKRYRFYDYIITVKQMLLFKVIGTMNPMKLNYARLRTIVKK